MTIKEEEIEALKIKFKKFEDWLNQLNIKQLYPKPFKNEKVG